MPSPDPTRDFAAEAQQCEEDYCRLLCVLSDHHQPIGLTTAMIGQFFGHITHQEILGHIAVGFARGHIETPPTLGDVRHKITPKGRDWITDNASRFATPPQSIFDKVSQMVGRTPPNSGYETRSQEKRLALLMFALHGADGLDRFREQLAVANITDPADIVKIEWDNISLSDTPFLDPDNPPAWAIARVWYMERSAPSAV